MREELEQKLMNEFPFMQARNVFSGKKLNFAISCDCEDGWYDLIYQLCKDIQIELDKIPKKYQKQFYPIQIKEKYSRLYFYTTPIHIKIADKIFDLINETEEKSSKICEMCGEKGQIMIIGTWYKTLCEKCGIKLGYRKIKENKL